MSIGSNHFNSNGQPPPCILSVIFGANIIQNCLSFLEPLLSRTRGRFQKSFKTLQTLFIEQLINISNKRNSLSSTNKILFVMILLFVCLYHVLSICPLKTSVCFHKRNLVLGSINMQNFFFRRCGLNKRMFFFCHAFFLASLLQKHERTLNKKLRYCPSLVVKWITGAVRNYLLLRSELKTFLKQAAQRPRRFQNNFFALL